MIAGFFMSSVMWDGPELAERYDRISDIQYKSGCMLLDGMHIKNGDYVLDVGCGTGRLAIYISEIVGPSGSVIGIDPSPHRIHVADAKLNGQAYKNVSFGIGKGEDLGNYPGNTFDHVYYSSVIHWIEDKKAAVCEAFRVLKPGGKVGLTTVDRSHQFDIKRMMEKLFNKEPYAGHINFEAEMSMLIDKKELDGLLSAAGFHDIDIESVIEIHNYPSPEKLFEFIEASSFGNFMRDVPDDLRSLALSDMKKEMEKMMTGAGLRLESKTVFAIAVKPQY